MRAHSCRPPEPDISHCEIPAQADQISRVVFDAAKDGNLAKLKNVLGTLEELPEGSLDFCDEVRILNGSLSIMQCAAVDDFSRRRRQLTPIFNFPTSEQGGRSAVHAAAICGSRVCLEFLIERGADIEAEDKVGMRPLHWASFLGKDKCVKALLQNGVEASAMSKVRPARPPASTHARLASQFSNLRCRRCPSDSSLARSPSQWDSVTVDEAKAYGVFDAISPLLSSEFPEEHVGSSKIIHFIKARHRRRRQEILPPGASHLGALPPQRPHSAIARSAKR